VSVYKHGLIYCRHNQHKSGGIIEQFSAFELLAELGLGLAGFAGVAAAFGGRAREYGKVDLSRLMVLFVCAGSVVVGSLAVITLAALGIEGETILVIVSVAMALIAAAAAFPLFRQAYRNTRNMPDMAPPYVLVAAAIYLITFESLLVLNIFKGGKPGFLLAAFSLSLIYGLWVFVRLMTRPN
jgi:hypothetical protein